MTKDSVSEAKKVYSRSVSQLKSYTKCGERYRIGRMRPRDQRVERPGAWTALGIAFHNTFQAWEKSLRTIDPVEYFAVDYDDTIDLLLEQQPNLDLWMMPPNTKSIDNSIKNYRNRGIEKDVPLYVQRCLEAEWEIATVAGNLALELEFELTFEKDLWRPVVVKGALDRLLYYPEDGIYALEDTKTGQADDDDHDGRQLGTYAYAIGENYGIEVKQGRYWFTKLDRGSKWFQMGKYTYSYLADLYISLDKAIDDRIFLPSPGKQCNLCGEKPWCREQGWLRDDELLEA